MKILISSHAFAPSIGGIETVSRLLAREFVAMDHEVIIVTQSAAGDADGLPFEVIRQPSAGTLLRLVKWSDIFWQNNLSLRTAWPALFLGKPMVITHQGSYCTRPAGVDLALRLKRAVAHHTSSVAISHAVAGCFETASVVIPNPYDAGLFTRSTSRPASRSGLVFVGRLVTEKGVDILLDALSRLSARNLFPRLTIVGAGSEERVLRKLAADLSLLHQVEFAGAKQPAEIAEILRCHSILVVPSKYDEPFGIVAVEGIACGCAVIGSAGGGLAQAIGPCGVTFPNGDAAALANVLESLLRDPGEVDRLAANGPAHLTQFHPSTVARSYVEIFASKLS